MLPQMSATAASITDDLRRLAGASAADIVAWGIARFGRQLAISSSFSIEDCVVIEGNNGGSWDDRRGVGVRGRLRIGQGGQ